MLFCVIGRFSRRCFQDFYHSSVDFLLPLTQLINYFGCRTSFCCLTLRKLEFLNSLNGPFRLSTKLRPPRTWARHVYEHSQWHSARFCRACQIYAHAWPSLSDHNHCCDWSNGWTCTVWLTGRIGPLSWRYLLSMWCPLQSSNTNFRSVPHQRKGKLLYPFKREVQGLYYKLLLHCTPSSSTFSKCP